MEKEFWKYKTIDEFTNEEWELLCDKCGWCCLFKFEDNNEEVKYSNIVCKYFDFKNSNCKIYETRSKIVKDCVKLTPEKTKEFKWLPKTCAYRLISENKPLPDWHPLIKGNDEDMKLNGIKIISFAISENDIDSEEIEDYINEEL